ncbi:MAG: alpha-hydroxy acid oxidase, partial [Pseudomonadota bacterium]
MTLDATYPALSDLRARAKRRLPHFVWEYLDSGTGSDRVVAKNRAALDRISFMPAILRGEVTATTETEFLGAKLSMPVGIAPVGMSGLIWPDAERILARAAAKAGIPYTLSTVASQTPEDVSSALGDHAWFQLYPPRDPDVRRDMLRRAEAAGFTTAVLTADLPAASRRERQIRSGLTQPPKLTPRILTQVAIKPAWAMAMAARGMPRMRLIDDYAPGTKGLTLNNHAGYQLRTVPDWDYLYAMRDEWPGKLIVKGVLDHHDVAPLQAAGVDAIWVSNHGGRQFDGAPVGLDMLPGIRAATDLPIVFDGAIEGGLDTLRAVALGADLVMLGRGWHYALGALGRRGPNHLAHILKSDLLSNMGQMALGHVTDIRQTVMIP